MAILSGRQCDVFVSYAHVDDLPDREGESGWVSQLTKQLEVRLLKRFGEKVEVWRDPQLRRAERFDPVIERAVRGAGVMVCLLSNRYLKSGYCQQEIAWFREQAGPHGLAVGDSLRVLPLLLYNIRPEQWPEVCQGTLGFNFFAAEDDEFGEPLAPASEAFGRQLRLLVEELYSLLTRLRESEPVRPVTATPATKPFQIFLAQPADELRPTSRQLAAALAGHGLEVVSGVPPPYEEKEHAAAVRRVMGEADLTVHLLGVHPGEPLEDDPARTYPIEQARLGLEHARSQLVPLPDEMALELIDRPAYAELLRSLGDRERDAGRFELIRAGRHRMVDEVLAKRRRLEEAARRRSEAPAGSEGIAFIDLHSHDVPHATDLVAYLVERRMTPIMIPAADFTPAAGMSLFEENLKRAKLFVVVFGGVARAWVEYRLQEAFKLILGHQLDTRIGVYVAPPEKAADQVRFPALFEVAVNMAGFDPATLKPLLAKVGALP